MFEQLTFVLALFALGISLEVLISTITKEELKRAPVPPKKVFAQFLKRTLLSFKRVPMALRKLGTGIKRTPLFFKRIPVSLRKLGRGKMFMGMLVVAYFAYVMFGLTGAVRFRGGWLDIAQPQDADILDPARTVYDMATRVIALIYEPLITWDYDMNYIPMLAESWDYDEAGMFYEFKLKRGVTFHCGHPFTAEAVRYTIDRIRTLRGSKHVESVQNILDVKVVDDYTARVYLKKDDRYIFDWFGTVSSVIVCPHCAEGYGEDFGTTEGPPCGTGPFKFKEWVVDSRIELERYESYNWGPKRYRNKGPAYIDGVTFHVVTEHLPRETWLMRGDIDFVTTVRKTRALLESWEEDPNIELINQAGYSLVYLGFNTAGTDDHGHGELSDKSVPKKVRQAIAYAINEDELISLALAGAGALPKSWLADGIWSSEGYQEEMYPYNPERARQLLAEAGYGEGDLTLEILFSDDPSYEDACAILKSQLEKVGITLDIQMLEFTALEDRITNKNYNMFMMGYTWSLADMIWWEWHTVRLPSPNRFWWGDDYTDEIIMDTWSMDDDVALEALRESQRLIAEDAASLALWQRPVLMAYRKDYVKGFRMHPQADKIWHFLDTYILLEKPYAVSISAFPDESSGSAGSELTYTVTVVNMGTEDDNYTLEVSDNAGWTLVLSDNMLEILSGVTEITNLIVAIPEDVTPGIQSEIIVNVTSWTDETVTDNARCIAYAIAS